MKTEPARTVDPENAIIPVYDPCPRTRRTPARGPPTKDLGRRSISAAYHKRSQKGGGARGSLGDPGEEGKNSRKRNQTVQHPNPTPYHTHLRDLRDARGDDGHERTGEETVYDSERHKWPERRRFLDAHPEREARKAREKGGGEEEVEPPETVGEVRGCDAPEGAACVQHGEDVEYRLAGGGDRRGGR